MAVNSKKNEPQDPDAVASAMAMLIHKHSLNADTIATEISNRFSKSAPMQTALARAYYRNNERGRTRHYLNKAIAIRRAVWGVERGLCLLLV